MKSSRWSKGWRGSRFLALSLLGHAAILLVAATTSLGRGCTPPPPGQAVAVVPVRNEPIDISLIEPTVLNPYASRPTAEEEKAAVELKVVEARKPEEERDPHGQVVDIAKPEVEVRPDDSARFLGEYDNKVEKETKGKPGQDRAGAQQRRIAMVQPQPGSRATPAQPRIEPVAPQAPQKGQGGMGKGALAMRSLPKPSDTSHGNEDGLEHTSDQGTVPREGNAAEVPSPAEKGAPGENRPGVAGQEGQEASAGTPDSLPRVGDLRPSDELLAQAVGAGSSDYLKDVDEGTDTLLNTKRWKYASFFTRVKRGVAQTWRPDVAYRLRDPTGQIYGHKNRFTVLKVSLKPDGSLRDVMVEKGCGVDFLDDEAVTAFREAQPFPNPPPGLVDPDSKLITFRFGFYFEITGAPTFRIFRQ